MLMRRRMQTVRVFFIKAYYLDLKKKKTRKRKKKLATKTQWRNMCSMRSFQRVWWQHERDCEEEKKCLFIKYRWVLNHRRLSQRPKKVKNDMNLLKSENHKPLNWSRTIEMHFDRFLIGVWFQEQQNSGRKKNWIAWKVKKQMKQKLSLKFYEFVFILGFFLCNVPTKKKTNTIDSMDPFGINAFQRSTKIQFQYLLLKMCFCLVLVIDRIWLIRETWIMATFRQ